MKVNGTKIAQKILDDLKLKIKSSKNLPHLAIVIAGDEPTSMSYVKQKILRAKEIGIKTTLIKLAKNISEQELLSAIHKLNVDKNINGIIVQKPLPSYIKDLKIDNVINPKKDIDGFNYNSLFTSPIGLTVLEVLENIYKNLLVLKNKRIVILGKGKTGGAPIKETLIRMGANPIIIDSKTKNPEEIIKTCDIVISAVGKRNAVDSRWLKKDVVLIGAGQHIEKDKKFYGDYNEEKIKNIASFYTPTPGGIGPINVAIILKSLVEASKTIDTKFTKG